MNKRVNPLYVVKNKGKDVEAANGIWDALIKILNLDKIVDGLQALLQMLWQQVNSWANLVALDNFLKSIIADLLILQNNFLTMFSLARKH